MINNYTISLYNINNNHNNNNNIIIPKSTIINNNYITILYLDDTHRTIPYTNIP